MAIIGLDLAISAQHQAVIADERGRFCGRALRLGTEAEALGELLARARQVAAAGEEIKVVMEPTGLSWFPVACYCAQHGATPYLVQAQRVAALRKYYRRHAKSDRISARVLARLPLTDAESLYPLDLAEADYTSGRRWCKQWEELSTRLNASRNRVQAWERGYWPGLEQLVKDLYAPWVWRWREAWYDPWLLQGAPLEALADFLCAAGLAPQQARPMAEALRQLARCVAALFSRPDGTPCAQVDYAALREQVLCEMRVQSMLEQELRCLKAQIRQVYRRLHPSRHLETMRGVGEQGAAAYVLFTAHPERFPSGRKYRAWSGMIPRSDQSGTVDKKGLGLTKSGPDLVKKYAFIDAETARLWDPQIAAIYYEQMVHRGKHHVQAVCCCATHLLDRVRAVLRDDKPYELRDVDGRPVTPDEARRIILERYTVPDEVRRRRTRQARRTERDQRAEQYYERSRNRPLGPEADAATPPQPGAVSAASSV
jgi:transposase